MFAFPQTTHHGPYIPMLTQKIMLRAAMHLPPIAILVFVMLVVVRQLVHILPLV